MIFGHHPMVGMIFSHHPTVEIMFSCHPTMEIKVQYHIMMMDHGDDFHLSSNTSGDDFLLPSNVEDVFPIAIEWQGGLFLFVIQPWRSILVSI